MKIKIFGQHAAATIRQIETCVAAGGERGVLCADGHKGYAQPIGGVVAYKDKISLSGVGFDIACGNLAILTDATRPQIAPTRGSCARCAISRQLPPNSSARSEGAIITSIFSPMNAIASGSACTSAPAVSDIAPRPIF